jgi:hexokinase
MPGLEAEISSEEFFRSISGYIEPLAGMTGKIGFCFSYPTEILPDLDGILLQFCKEIQAPEVVGKQIGKNLLSSLRMPEKHIVLLNDTVATLLAGKSGTMGKEYDSYIGFILGTGTNTCYVERNSEITKMPGLDKEKSMIINIESGNFSKVSPGEIDEIYDKTTGNPGTYRFEKMISGAYFGGLCLTALEKAAEEGLFSPATIQNIYNIKELSTEDVNIFLTGQSGGKSNRIQKAISTKSDEVHFMKIINALVERAAVLVSANLAAVILKTGKGRSSDKPVMITIEGTTFYKLHGLKDKFENYFRQYLSGDKQRYYEFSEVPHSSLVGAGLAALIL